MWRYNMKQTCETGEHIQICLLSPNWSSILKFNQCQNTFNINKRIEPVITFLTSETQVYQRKAKTLISVIYPDFLSSLTQIYSASYLHPTALCSVCELRLFSCNIEDFCTIRARRRYGDFQTALTAT